MEGVAAIAASPPNTHTHTYTHTPSLTAKTANAAVHEGGEGAQNERCGVCEEGGWEEGGWEEGGWEERAWGGGVYAEVAKLGARAERVADDAGKGKCIADASMGSSPTVDTGTHFQTEP